MSKQPGLNARNDVGENVNNPISPFILIKGAGEMASAVAWRLYMANMRRICMLELDQPLALRLEVSFCTALKTGATIVEGVEALAASSRTEILDAWNKQKIALVLAGEWESYGEFKPEVVIDATLAKRNLGTSKVEAPLVIALGPGFEAGKECHLVIETNRGHDLGRIIHSGRAEQDTGKPGEIAGYTEDRVLRAPVGGVFHSEKQIGDLVHKGEVLGYVSGNPVAAKLDGILRGLISSGMKIPAGVKIGDIDPRGKRKYCFSISDKARAISGSVPESVMRHANRPASKCDVEVSYPLGGLRG